MNQKISHPEPSSFKDPAGFLFYKNSQLYRQINKEGKDDFDIFIKSGLYQKLTRSELLIPHLEIAQKSGKTKNFYKLIKPQPIPFISYPFEWSFSQLKDAALLTLEIQEIALSYNMTLKDASSYNVQFIGYKPIFIDTLSFQKYKDGEPWIAYRQFCQHFLAPLSLMAKKDPRLNFLLRDFIDGIPLDLTSKILPTSTLFNFSLFTHIHLHALNQKRMSTKKINKIKYKMTKFQMFSLIKNLKSSVSNLKLKNFQTEWKDYYQIANYSKKAFIHKQALFKKFLGKVKPKNVVDLGANEGLFSRIASKMGVYTIACDLDQVAIEKAYLQAKQEKNKRLLPLVIDLTNPTPNLGWANIERKSFTQRARADCVCALALIHHLSISNNLPFSLIADYFSSLGDYLIIEFVPKQDSNVQILLQNREDIFKEYSKKGFEKAFKKYFEILENGKIEDSERELYLMKRK